MINCEPKVKILADSISEKGIRLTTFELEYWRAIHCFHKDTELLVDYNNDRFFMKIPEVCKLLEENKDLKVAAYHENNDITFEKPVATIAKPFKGKLISILNHRQISFAVTPEHRLYVGSRKAKGDKWEIIQAKELDGNTQKRFLKAGNVVDGYSSITELQAELLGFFIGDGTLTAQGKCVFHLKKERKKIYLENLLDVLGITYVKSEYKDNIFGYSFYQPTWFPKDCYINKEKNIPSIITTAIPNIIRKFLYGIWFSDGDTTKTDCIILNTSSPYVAHKLSALAAMSGSSINVTHRFDNGMYKLTNSKSTKPVWRKDKYPISYIDYDDNVYCVTVSTGLLVSRFNGITNILGNCELLTHRVFSRNARSSRATPIKVNIQNVKDNPWGPRHWTTENKGMVSQGELPATAAQQLDEVWLQLARGTATFAEQLGYMNIHKQITNRLLEPFSSIQVVLSATDFKNFFKLREDSHAQPEMQDLTKAMHKAMYYSEPELVKEGEWHLPYVTGEEKASLDIEVLKDISVARCARVSYKAFDGSSTVEKDLELAKKLKENKHMSAFEHIATPAPEGGYLQSNFRGWNQYRKFIPDECVVE